MYIVGGRGIVGGKHTLWDIGIVWGRCKLWEIVGG